ncbi:hypothetical protein RUM44_007331 [Polyplax serrata]|uniref:C3H1-type domain-containing protein n=1 Tax=Polyplax serrata TaxID=468196 RepID=A0ABR1B0C7_POLSC
MFGRIHKEEAPERIPRVVTSFRTSLSPPDERLSGRKVSSEVKANQSATTANVVSAEVSAVSQTPVILFPVGATPPPLPPPIEEPAMAMVNMNNLINGKDPRWLQLEVCREFQRNKCTRSDTECKFAHPPANLEVQNGKVMACYDSIKLIKEDYGYRQMYQSNEFLGNGS